ncbi:hypothetical protein [Echinimonas agarilytica]|uniref:Uncharacterized protein n=1 Tax=Echinimonas agarilytica TaxID=1215918 RepID=A0AA41W8B3_9GAMM|nr:hypothetical protein [Echinimonas agarilytica]MCM2680357.1 hypothetical protein [Echinimonas agarilytica]
MQTILNRSAHIALGTALCLSTVSAFGCDNHGPVGFGYAAINANLNAKSARTAALSQAMDLSIAPRLTVRAGQPAQVPYSVGLPNTYHEATISWHSSDSLQLDGNQNQSLASGTDHSLHLTLSSDRPGTYTVRGKLTALVDGEATSKYSYLLVNVVGSQPSSSETARTSVTR